jgi:hypothetical protein
MRLIVPIAIGAICLSLIAGCSLIKSNNQSNQNTSAQTTGTPLTTAPAGSESPTDAHAAETAGGGGTEVNNDELHTPAKGTEERQAIMDALRGNQQVVFQVNYLKVHNGWCWVDTTPLDKSGRATAEGGPNLLHLENGSWKVKDLSKVPDDPNDPLGPEDPSPTYIRNVIKTFPGVPRDIFPKAGK